MMPYAYGNRMAYNVRTNAGEVHATHTVLSMQFQRYLWQDLIGVLKWELPESWSYDYFTGVLYWAGYIAVFNTDKFGVIPQYASPMGFNVFYEPTQMVVNSPLFAPAQPTIGVQCTVIRITPDWCGLEDIVTYYADLMATCCSAVGVNLINSKLAYVFFGKNEAMSQTFKGLYDRIASGEPSVVLDKDCINPNGEPNWSLFDTGVASNYITDKLLVDLEKIRNMFRTHVGIPNSNTEKKERQLVDEVNSNNTATRMLTDTMLDRARRGVEQTNRMFGLDISVDWRYDPDEEILSKLDGDAADGQRSDGRNASARGAGQAAGNR